MIPAREVEFGCVIAAAGEQGTSDADLYTTMLGDAELAVELGYTSLWSPEHHFSDYFPTPNPLLLLGHIADRFPDVDLGTSVLVTPWHEPLRLAGEIAMLSLLTRGRLLMGMGRGTAKYEYDAFGLDMSGGRARFEEIAALVGVALKGEPFRFEGAEISMQKEVSLRPRLPREAADRIQLLGAIGSPGSATVIADLGLPPLCTTIGDLEAQARIIEAWDARTAEAGGKTDVVKPIAINCIIEDTRQEALEKAETFIPRYMQAQVKHYTPEEVDWEDLPSYQGWKGQFEGMKRMTDPANIAPWTEYQLVGTPDHVGEVLGRYIDAGFNHVILHCATPGVPAAERRRWMRRFAEEIAPRYTGGHSGVTVTGAA